MKNKVTFLLVCATSAMSLAMERQYDQVKSLEEQCIGCIVKTTKQADIKQLNILTDLKEEIALLQNSLDKKLYVELMYQKRSKNKHLGRALILIKQGVEITTDQHQELLDTGNSRDIINSMIWISNINSILQKENEVSCLEEFKALRYLTSKQKTLLLYTFFILLINAYFIVECDIDSIAPLVGGFILGTYLF